MPDAPSLAVIVLFSTRAPERTPKVIAPDGKEVLDVGPQFNIRLFLIIGLPDLVIMLLLCQLAIRLPEIVAFP
jgi:hypothetical protein